MGPAYALILPQGGSRLRAQFQLSISANGGGPTIKVGNKWVRATPDDIAAMKATPDLLAALQAVATWCSDPKDDRTTSDIEDAVFAALAKARAA